MRRDALNYKLTSRAAIESEKRETTWREKGREKFSAVGRIRRKKDTRGCVRRTKKEGTTFSILSDQKKRGLSRFERAGRH